MKKILITILIPCLLLITSMQVKAWEYDGSDNLYFDYVPTYNESYYSSLTGLNQENFREELNDIITNNYNRYTYSNRLNILREADAVHGSSEDVWCMYTGKIFTTTDNGSSGTSTWNTEHTWAKSWGFPSESDTPYSDFHHLRITECQTNAYRSNSWFGEVSNPTSTDNYGNKWTSSIFEPRDSVKGDIARMLFYMDVRYDGENGETDLILIDGFTATSGDALHGDLETLIKWHNEDPVDDRERERNDIVYSYQKNRNPFVDHPEYVDIVWGDAILDNSDIFDNMVNSISTPITEASIIEIDNAFDFYYTLSEEEKSLVTKYSVLLEYKELYNEIVSNNEKAATFDSMVEDIQTPITISSKTQIEAALSYYESLNSEQRLLTTKYNILIGYENDYNICALNADKAKEFDDMVNEFTTIDITSGPAILAAFEFYDSLTAEQKALTTNYATLLGYNVLYNDVVDYNIAKEFDNMVIAISSIALDSEEIINEAFDFYNSLTDAQKAKTTKYSTLVDNENFYLQLVDIDKATTFDNLVESIETPIALLSKNEIIYALEYYDSLTLYQQGLTTSYDDLLEYYEELIVQEVINEAEDDLDLLHLILNGDYSALFDAIN